MEADAEEAECHHTHTHTLFSALRFHELGRLGHLLLSLSTQEVLEGQISQLNIREVFKKKSLARILAASLRVRLCLCMFCLKE